MDQTGESDSSDWDSTLDFTSPRQTGPPPVFPRIEVEDEDDVSHMDSRADKPKPKERSSPANQDDVPSANYMDAGEETSNAALYATPQKRQKASPKTQKGSRQGSDTENHQPPYNFTSAINGNLTPEPQKQRPGKDRKENIYDVVDRPSPSASPNLAARRDDNRQSLQSLGSWDDSDPDERTLRELRQNFSKEKQKEQAAEDLKLRLQSEHEKGDEPLATNRSEVSTWKSWASGVGKKNNSGAVSSRSKGRKKDKNRPVSAREVKASMSREPALRSARAEVVADQQQQLQPPSQQQQLPAQRIEEVQVRGLVPVMEAKQDPVTLPPAQKETYNDIPAYIDPPYIVKDEDGRNVYYFGHGSLQYYEVEDDAIEAFMPRMADKFENLLQRIYQEFFGLLRIITSFVILLVVELFKFIIKSIFNPILVGIFGTFGDFVFKPILSIIFNGFIQPLGVFFWNCFIALRHMFSPIADILKKVFVQLAFLCRSIRLIEIHWKTEGTKNGRPVDYNPNDFNVV